MAHVKEVEVEPPMHLQRPSSGRSQDVSHLLASLFRELFTREPVGEETVKHLSTSKSGEDGYHDKYVEQLRKIQGERDERHRQADMLEAHIMQAQAASTAADERELQDAAEGCENYFSLGLPPGRSNLRYCLDNEFLKRHHLIVPEDFASEDSPPVRPPEAGEIPNYARHTSSSHQRYRRTPPLTDYVDDLRSSSSLAYPFMSKATVMSNERRNRESPPPSAKTKYSKSWKESMKPDQREVEREDLRRLQSRAEYKRNPRFVPPLRADLVKQKEKKKAIKSKKDKDEGVAENIDVFLPTPNPVVFTDYSVNGVYELTLDLKNITSSSRQVRVVPPRTSHFSVGLGKFPGDAGVVAPGMSCQYPIRFAPDLLADYDDVIKIKSQAVPDLEIPLQARRPPPVLTLSSILDCGHCLVGGKKIIKLTCQNNGGDGRFCIMDKANWPTVSFPWDMLNPGSVQLESFELKPAMFELKAGDTIVLESTFCPSAAKFFSQEIVMVCDNCNIRFFSLQGTGQTADIQFVSVSGGLSEPGIGEIRDASAQFFVRFRNQNPKTRTDKTLVIKNTTNVALPFHWKLYKPALQCPNIEDDNPGRSRPSTHKIRTRDESKTFSIAPNMGTMPPHETVEFSVEFAPKNLGEFRSVLHLVLEAIPLHAATPEVHHTKDVTAIELELAAASKPFNVRVEPSAVIVPGTLTLGNTYKYPIKMFNHSVSEVHFTWEPVEIAGGTITVEPRQQFLVVDEELDVELCITGSRRGILDETIYCNIDFISTPVYLNVKTNFEGPEVTMDIPDLDFGLVRLGESCTRQIPIRNLSSVAAQWTVDECLECCIGQLEKHKCEGNYTPEFSFTPQSGSLGPGESTDVCVTFAPEGFRRVRTAIQCEAVNGKTSFLSVRGEVQTPQVCLLSCNLYIEEVYVGVPVAREVVLQNQTLLSARFQWNELADEDGYTVTFEPSQGSLQPRETLSVKVLFTGHKKGPVSNLVTSCEVEGMDTPIYLAMRGDVRGLSVTLETPKEIDIERPGEESIQQWDSSTLLLDFEEVSLGSNPKTTLVLTNTSAIRTSFSIDMEYFRAAKPPTPPQGTPIYRAGGQRTQNLLRRTANIADPISKTATKAHEDYCQAVLRDGRGAAFVAYPSSGELLPFGYQVVDVIGYSDMWGQYKDRLVCKVEGMEPVCIPATMNVIGCPLNFQMMRDQKPVLRFGTHVSGAPAIKRSLRVNNTSPYDIRLDWETYNIEPDDDQLLDLLVFVGRPLPVLKDGLEVEPTADQQEEDEQPFIQVKLREHEGKSSNRPFEVTPSQQVIPSKGFSQVTVCFVPHTDSNTGQSRISFASAYMSLDGPNTNIPGHVTRTHGIEMTPFRLDVTANVKPAMLSVEMEEDKGTHFLAAASDLVKDVKGKVHRFVLRNTTEASLQLSLDVAPPFSLLSLEPPPSAKSSRSQPKGIVTVKPNKNVEVKVSFSVTREQIARVKEMTAGEEQQDGSVYIVKDSGERRLEFKKDLKIEFSNKTTQNRLRDFLVYLDGSCQFGTAHQPLQSHKIVFFRGDLTEPRIHPTAIIQLDYTQKVVLPLTAIVVVPTLRLSRGELDFGTCLVGQERELNFTLYNPTASHSSWSVRKDPRYPEISRGAFDIKPSRGDLDAYVSHVSQNKVLVKVTFIARHNVAYECVFIFNGSLEEEEQKLVVRGKGSYDGRHENLVNVLTDF